jgi:hypothetical protein
LIAIQILPEFFKWWKLAEFWDLLLQHRSLRLLLLSKKKLKLRAHPILQELNRMLSVIPTHQSNLDQAYLSGFKDLEDAFQYYTAMNENNVDYFVSNNVKDFKTVLPKLPVVSSTMLVKILIKEI